MAFFQCSKCHCSEDTVLSRYWSARVQQIPILCSACDPKIAKWHGEFPQESAEWWFSDKRGFLWNPCDRGLAGSASVPARMSAQCHCRSIMKPPFRRAAPTTLAYRAGAHVDCFTACGASQMAGGCSFAERLIGTIRDDVAFAGRSAWLRRLLSRCCLRFQHAPSTSLPRWPWLRHS